MHRRTTPEAAAGVPIWQPSVHMSQRGSGRATVFCVQRKLTSNFLPLYMLSVSASSQACLAAFTAQNCLHFCIPGGQSHTEGSGGEGQSVARLHRFPTCRCQAADTSVGRLFRRDQDPCLCCGSHCPQLSQAPPTAPSHRLTVMRSSRTAGTQPSRVEAPVCDVNMRVLVQE